MASDAAAPRSEASQTLSRGLQVLEVLAEQADSSGLTMTELAAALGVGRPVVYRLVTTLEAHQLVRRRADGRAVLALGVTRLAAAVTPVVQAEARPVLRELADAVGATAHLTIAEGEQALALVVVEPSWTDFHVAYRSGTRHRLDEGAAGRAILAGRAGDAGGTRPVATSGELQQGAHGLAVPLGAAGVEASVGVVALTPLDVAVVGPRLDEAATALRALLR